MMDQFHKSRVAVWAYSTIVAAALQVAGCHELPEVRFVEVRVFDAETSNPLPRTRVAIGCVEFAPGSCRHGYYRAPPTDDAGITIIPIEFYNGIGGPLLFRLDCEPGSPEVNVALEESASGTNASLGIEILSISTTPPADVPALVATAAEGDEGIRIEIQGYFPYFEVCDEDEGVVLLDLRSPTFTPLAVSLPVVPSSVQTDLCGNLELEETLLWIPCERAAGTAAHRRFRIDVRDPALPGYAAGATTRFCTDESISRLVACDGS